MNTQNTEQLIEETIAYFKTLKSSYERQFKTHRPELYQFIFDYSKFFDKQNPTFRARLACVVFRQQKIRICENENCTNEIDMRDSRPTRGFPKFCSHKCLNSSKQIK